MNVYDACNKSNEGVALHKDGSVCSKRHASWNWYNDRYPDGWQPLYTSDEVEQWKQSAEKAEVELDAATEHVGRVCKQREDLKCDNAKLRKQLAKAEAQLYAACQQLAGEYQLGKPLKKAKNGKRYIAIHKETGEILQGQFIWTGPIQGKTYTYYADPRPLLKPPEVKEEPTLFVDEFDGTFSLTAEGRRRLEKLLRESEGE